jgi:hypothetical protein
VVAAGVANAAASGDSSLRKVVVDASAAKAPEQSARRKKIRLNPASLPNEQGAKGAPEGNA